MGIGDRISGWVNERRDEWGAALGTFLATAASTALVGGLEKLEPGALEGVKDILGQIRDDENTPENPQPFLDKTSAHNSHLFPSESSDVRYFTENASLAFSRSWI